MATECSSCQWRGLMQYALSQNEMSINAGVAATVLPHERSKQRFDDLRGCPDPEQSS
jgi:hypothetical protein